MKAKNTFFKVCALGFMAIVIAVALAPKEKVNPEGFYGVKSTVGFVGEMPKPQT